MTTWSVSIITASFCLNSGLLNCPREVQPLACGGRILGWNSFARESPQCHYLESLLFASSGVCPGSSSSTGQPRASALANTNPLSSLHAALPVSHAGFWNARSTSLSIVRASAVLGRALKPMPSTPACWPVAGSEQHCSVKGGLPVRTGDRCGQDIWLGRMQSMRASSKASVAKNQLIGPLTSHGPVWSC